MTARERVRRLSDAFSPVTKRLSDPKAMVRFHATMTVVWVLLLVPSLLWWSESVLWVIVMSLWANVTGHWASFQAAHAEKRTKEQESE